jgi:hypothetical protein
MDAFEQYLIKVVKDEGETATRYALESGALYSAGNYDDANNHAMIAIVNAHRGGAFNEALEAYRKFKESGELNAEK